MVAVRESLEEWFALEPDKVVVQQLDMGNVRVISHIIGQSVALDHYNKKVGMVWQCRLDSTDFGWSTIQLTTNSSAYQCIRLQLLILCDMQGVSRLATSIRMPPNRTIQQYQVTTASF